MAAQTFLQKIVAASVLCFATLICADKTAAHLLNMSRVETRINNEQTAEATLQLDLSREAGTGEEYFRWSRLATPAEDPKVAAMLSRLLKAIVVTVDGEGGGGGGGEVEGEPSGERLQWQVKKIVMPSNQQEADFTSGFAWPMTALTLIAQLPTSIDEKQKSPAEITAQFTDAFRFEEPIATSISCTCSELSLNRWLVRNQISPVYYPNGNPQAADVNKDRSWISVWQEYIVLGISHIIPKGWDHALFVLGLFFGMTQLRHLIIWVSGFTLAHSLTLGLASFGAIEVPANIVEPAIALTIAYVAVENIVIKPNTYWRLAIVFLFGLIHGLGFAAVLKNLGFPAGEFLSALIGFNIGVEVAQLAIIAIAWLLLARWRNSHIWQNYIVNPGSSLIALIAIYWTISRVIH